jgi:hypothetical protein
MTEQSNGVTRRTSLRTAAVSVAAAIVPQAGWSWSAPANPLGGFEVSSSLYPWDLHDEGIEHICDNLQSMAEVNSVYVLGIMHYEIRPLTSPSLALTSPHYTHNPVRLNWQARGLAVLLAFRSLHVRPHQAGALGFRLLARGNRFRVSRGR